MTEQTHCRGPGRFAGHHQATGHQRRRLLQRQLGASVRESDAAVELRRDAVDPADPGRAVLHVRQDGRRHAAGLGGAGGDAGDLRAAAAAWATGPSKRAIPSLAALGVDQAASDLQAGRQHGGQGSPLRHRQLGALGDGHHGRLATAASTRCTIRTRRWAAWCRCG